MNKFSEIVYGSLYFTIYKISWFSRRKLLNYIRNDKNGTYIDTGGCKLTKQNWSTGRDKKFLNLFCECFFNDFKKHSLNELNFELELKNVWYQVYNDKDTYHGFHTHPRSNISKKQTIFSSSNIIYLELNDENLSTEFIGTNGEIIKPKVKQGDTLSFNPSILHRSPPHNNQKAKKTIVSFNCNIIARD